MFTARFTRGTNAFEYRLATLRIQQKNGHPGHPQTQGKIERFHQTLKKWLTRQPAANTVTDVQTQLDTFQQMDNHQRPHRALGGATPTTSYHATPKAWPHQTTPNQHFRIRLDRVDTGGKVSLRRAGGMHHLNVGYTHRKSPVLILIDETTATVTHRTTGEILSHHHINPTRTYWRNTNKEPGRWPSSQQ